MSWGGELVSGEAVLLDLRLARFPSRALAKLIDVAIQVALLVLISYLLTADDVDDAAAAAISLVATVAVIVGYPLLLETLTNGRTVGKLALGQRVVRDDGGSVRFRHSLVRALVGVFEVWLTLGIVATLTSLASSRGKRLGDYAAGTVVLRERMPTQVTAVVAMPYQLSAWAAGLELSRLPDPLALAARQVLGRAQTLAPEARLAMTQRVAADVAQYVSPAPPVGCPPETYLAAVLAERRRRETARYERQAAAAQPWQPSSLPPRQPAPQAPLLTGADPEGFHPPG